jgi:NitT/TauT family transport system substrate-binding protein
MVKIKRGPKILLGAVGVAGVLFAGNYYVKNHKAELQDKVSHPGEASAADTGNGALGTPTNPLKVGIVSFHGYAPALYANGNNLDTQPGSIFANKGVSVKFVIQDNVPTLTETFIAGTAHCSWRTSDFWAQEQPNLREAKLDARTVMVVDNTQGADAIIAKDPNVRSIEDLAGRSIALLQYTPSHGMLADALENSSLSARKRASVKQVYINVEEGTAGVRAALEKGSVDAAALWDPDLSLALKAVAGSHVVYSTKIASNLIYDIVVCDQRVLGNPENEPAITAFVDGWLTGVKAVNEDKSKGVQALTKTEEMFKMLSNDQGANFVQGLFGNIVLTDLAANVRILGMAGGTNHYERVYTQFDGVYRGIGGTLTNPHSPVINASDSIDYRFIKALAAKDSSAQAVAKQDPYTFTDTGSKVADKAQPVVTKPVVINFDVNSAALSGRAQAVVDHEVRSLVESYGSSYFEVNGNTDSTGTAAVNKRISLARAQAVVDHLVKEWDFPRARFVVKGNGPDAPLCNETHPDDGVSLEDCRALNRTTRIAVLGR